MRKALSLAKRGLGRTSPNPVVGAVVVREGNIIASGYHKGAGLDHAEVEALKTMKGKAYKGDILYVTLEPCNHFGRTPPCTEAILEKGIRNVVIGTRDPNQDVRGGGIEYLEKNGVHVKTGVLETECREINESFIKYVTTGRPFVMAKSAMTLDGWIATSCGHSQWITNEKSRYYVHRLRDRVDGIMVGVGTIISDDPSLTTRLRRRKGKDPLRIIVDSRFRIPHNAKVLNLESDSKTIIITGPKGISKAMGLMNKDSVSIISCPIKAGHIDLNYLMEKLGQMSVTSLMVEGGSRIMGSMIRENLVDKYYIFKASKLLGGSDGIPMAHGKAPKKMDDAFLLRNIKVKRFGNDTLIMGYSGCLPD